MAQCLIAMEHRSIRQELYDLVWSRPMKHLAVILGVTVGVLCPRLRRADVPKPSPGHWTRKEFSKPIGQPPLPQTPSGCVEPLVLNTEKQQVRLKSKSVEAEARVADVGAPQAHTPLGKDSAQSARMTPPTNPTTIARKDLYRAVWAAPMSRLAEGYGLSDSGLAKIWRRAKIPCAPRGHRAKLAVGKAPHSGHAV